jgi:hypothetical protein
MLKSDGMQTISSCNRCKGLLIQDTVLAESGYWINCLRCINCGWVWLSKKVIYYANQTKDRRIDRVDELELYRTRRRNPKCRSNSI